MWPPPAASYNPRLAVCENALLGLRWEVIHDDSGTILGVGVTVNLGSVYPASDGSASYAQAYELKFTTAVGASLKPLRSGNIGYTLGDPVLAGVQESSGGKTAVKQSVRGLAVPSPGREGRCDGKTTPVPFGTAMQSCCTVDLTLEELKARCLAAQSGDLGYGIQAGINASTLIGIYGGSDAGVLQDWMALPEASRPSTDAVNGSSYAAYNTLGYGYGDQATRGASLDGNTGWEAKMANQSTVSPSTAGSSLTVWDSNTRTCYGVTGGIHIQFTYALEGAYRGPSRWLTRVAQEYVRATWGWDEDTANGDGTQTFPMCYTVHFAEASTLVSNVPTMFVSRVLFWPVLGIHDTWGMEGGVITWLAVIYCGAPALAALWLIRSPVSFTRRLFSVGQE